MEEIFGEEEALAICDKDDGPSGGHDMKDDDGSDVHQGDDDHEDPSPGEHTTQHRPPVPRGRRIHLPGLTGKNARNSRSAAAAQLPENWTTDPRARGDKTFLTAVAQSKIVQAAAQSRKLTQISNRRLLEFCCSEDSILGNMKYVQIGCHIVRLTEKHDLTTDEGMRVAINAVENTPDGMYLHLWGSLPCTGGSTWQRINRTKGPETVEKIEEHVKKVRELLPNFCRVAEAVLRKRGDVSFEWPSSCTLWNEPQVVEMLERFSMNRVEMHGCSAGLVSKKSGLPI